ncbi:hypothetical protein NL676_001017 [Syzygium grande]|nr:hypothetical protein NL676_001017 [Syzygium grande]
MDPARLKSYGLLMVCGILASLSIVVTICFSCGRHGRNKPGPPRKNRPTGGATGGDGLSDGSAFANTLLYSSAYGVVVDGGDGGGDGGDHHHQGHDGGGGSQLHHHHHHHDGGQNGGGYSGDGRQYDIGGEDRHDGGGSFSAGGGFDGGGHDHGGGDSSAGGGFDGGGFDGGGF